MLGRDRLCSALLELLLGNEQSFGYALRILAEMASFMRLRQRRHRFFLRQWDLTVSAAAFPSQSVCSSFEITPHRWPSRVP